MSARDGMRRYHAARWDEPVVMELGYPGRRGQVFPPVDDAVRRAVGQPEALVPPGMWRSEPPRLPELSEPGRRGGSLRHIPGGTSVSGWPTARRTASSTGGNTWPRRPGYPSSITTGSSQRAAW